MEQETYEQFKAQELLQQNQLDSEQFRYVPQIQEYQEQSRSVLVDQTNPKKIVKDIMLRLRGLEEMPDGTLVQVAEPKVNKKGVDNIWFVLDSHINQGVILSHLEAADIRNLMDGLSDDLVDDLSLNWRIYGIKRKSDLDVINNSILYNVFLALKRAEGQNEKNWLGKISLESINTSSRSLQPKKEGFWSKLRL